MAFFCGKRINDCEQFWRAWQQCFVSCGDVVDVGVKIKNKNFRGYKGKKWGGNGRVGMGVKKPENVFSLFSFLAAGWGYKKK